MSWEHAVVSWLGFGPGENIRRLELSRGPGWAFDVELLVLTQTAPQGTDDNGVIIGLTSDPDASFAVTAPDLMIVSDRIEHVIATPPFVSHVLPVEWRVYGPVYAIGTTALFAANQGARLDVWGRSVEVPELEWAHARRPGRR